MTVRRRQIGAVMLLPTLAEVLELPAVRRGEPAVRAGSGHLDRPGRWVHVSEVSDIAHLLEGGELILTTGIALPESPAALTTYVDELAAVGVSGVAVELGRRYQRALPGGPVAPRWRAAAGTGGRGGGGWCRRPSGPGCRCWSYGGRRRSWRSPRPSTR